MKDSELKKSSLRRNCSRGLQALATAGGGMLFLLVAALFVLAWLFSLLPGDGATDSVLSLILSPWVVKVAGRTLTLALLSTLLSLGVGIPLSFFTATRTFPGRRFLLSLSAIPLCLPPLLVALGYVMFWGMQGVVNRLVMKLGGGALPTVEFLYSWVGIVLAQGFYNFPLVMKTCADAWSQLPRNQHDAALLLGASPWRVFRTITLVQLLPAIATSAMVVFLYCFFSFVIVLVFGGVGTCVLEVEIYQAARSSLNFPQVAALALVETVLALAVVALYSVVEGPGHENKGIAWDSAGLGRKKVAGWLEGLFLGLLLALVLLFFLLPLLQLVLSAFSGGSAASSSFLFAGSFSFQYFQNLFSRPSFYLALKNTLLTASLSSLLAVASALFYSLLLQEWSVQRAGKQALGGGFLFLGRVLPLLPMAVSSVVLAIGATSLSVKVLPGLRGSPWMLVFLQAALYWPFAFRQISGALEKVPSSVDDAARMLADFPLDRVFRVYLPLCRKNILAALGFCFALGCGDTTLPLVLAIPRFETLALYTYNLAGSYRFGEACCSGLVLAALTMPIFLVSGRGLKLTIRKKLKATSRKNMENENE